MDENTSMTKVKWLVVAAAWCFIIGLGVTGYKWFIEPSIIKQEEIAKEKEEEEILDKTSSQSRFAHTVNIHLDGFSGYALLRTHTFRDECAKKGIRIVLVDDKANYPDRLKALADGKCEMAVFTWDALIKTSASYGDKPPATIVGLIDETKGADAIVAAGDVFPNIDAMNDPSVKVVVTPDSPSEFMTRVIMHHYNLPQLPKDPFVPVDGAGEVYNRYKSANPKTKQVYALWEPYVTKMASNPDFHILTDSSKFRGYIVDVMVCSRHYLVEHESVVEDVMKAYLTTVFLHRSDMVDVVFEDSKQTLDKEQSKKLVDTIWFKNTTETFGHFGFTSGGGLQHMEEIGANITEVLVKTGAISKDPADGRASMWYYDGIMRRLFDNSWYPGFESEGVRKESVLARLSDEEWKDILPVGTLNVPRLVFKRGSSELSTSSLSTLDILTKQLETWPQYYLVVRGHSQKTDNVEVQEQNEALAKKRAQSAVSYLIGMGINSDRIRADSSPNGSSTVQFLLGEVPY